MTTAEAREIVYRAVYNREGAPDWFDPTGDTDADLVEFARVLLWGLSQKWLYVNHWDCTGITIRMENRVRTFPVEGIPRTAFLHALAAAIVAKREGTT